MNRAAHSESRRLPERMPCRHACRASSPARGAAGSPLRAPRAARHEVRERHHGSRAPTPLDVEHRARGRGTELDVRRAQQRARLGELDVFDGQAQAAQRGRNQRCVGERPAERHRVRTRPVGRRQQRIRHQCRIERARDGASARGEVRHDDADPRFGIRGEAVRDPVGHSFEFIARIGRRQAPAVAGTALVRQPLDPGAPGRKRLEQRRLLRRRFVEARQDHVRGRGKAPVDDQRAHDIRQPRLIDRGDALDASLVLGGPPGEHPRVLRQRVVTQSIRDLPLMGKRPCLRGKLRGAGRRCQRHVACIDHAFPQRAVPARARAARAHR